MDDWFGFQRGLVAVGLLAAVPGCPNDDKDKTTGDAGTGSSGDTGGTTGGTTGNTTGDSSSGSGTDGPTSTTGTPTTGEATTSEATTGEATTGEPEIPPACAAFGAKFTECYDARMGMFAAAYCATTLETYQMTYGAGCAQAYEALLACLSALTCAEFTSPDPSCAPEEAKLETACSKP